MRISQGTLLILQLIKQVMQQQPTRVDKSLPYNVCYPRVSARNSHLCFPKKITVGVDVNDQTVADSTYCCLVLYSSSTFYKSTQSSGLAVYSVTANKSVFVAVAGVWLYVRPICIFEGSWTWFYSDQACNNLKNCIFLAVHRTNARANIYGLKTISVLTLRD